MCLWTNPLLIKPRLNQMMETVIQILFLYNDQGWLKSAILGRGSSYKDFVFFGLKSRGGVAT